MKKFFLQTISVFVVMGLIWSIQNYGFLQIKYNSYLFRKQQAELKKQWLESMAKAPRFIAEKRTLPCGTLGNLTVALGCDEITPELAKQNMDEITNRWASIWPSVEQAFQKEMKEYDHDFHEKNATPILSVAFPGEPWSKESKWRIFLKYEPFNGIWTLNMRGFDKVGQCVADF